MTLFRMYKHEIDKFLQMSFNDLIFNSLDKILRYYFSFARPYLDMYFFVVEC